MTAGKQIPQGFEVENKKTDIEERSPIDYLFDGEPLLMSRTGSVIWTGEPEKLPITVTYIAIGGGAGRGYYGGGGGSGYLETGEFELTKDTVQVTIGDAGGHYEDGDDTCIGDHIKAQGGKGGEHGTGGAGWCGGGGGGNHGAGGDGGDGGSGGSSGLDGTSGGHGGQGQGTQLPSVTLEQGDLRPGSGGKGFVIGGGNAWGGGGGGFCVKDNNGWEEIAGEGYGAGGGHHTYGNGGAVILYIKT